MEKPDPEQINQWNRWFAVECNNRAWDLASLTERSAEQDKEMLYAAYAAAYHWFKVGLPIRNARADITLAHVLALLGEGKTALQHAQNALTFFEGNECEDWDLAFAHAEIAHAALACGKKDLHRKHYQLAQEKGQAIQEDEERHVFFEEFAKIPKAELV